MKIIFTRLLLIFILSPVPILILFIRYHAKLKVLSYDFERRIPFEVTDIKGLDLRFNSYYIAGSSDENIYLGNYTTLPRLLRTNSPLTDTQTINIDLRYTTSHGVSDYKIYVDSINFYVFYGLERSILKGKTNEWRASTWTISCPFFQESVPLNDNSLVFRYVSSKTQCNAFRKATYPAGTIENDTILIKQVDGQYCTSGNLEYNKNLQLFTYLYAYRNEIIVMDTSLNLVRKIKTIDPIDSAFFNVSAIQSNGSSVITTPALLVNPKCATWKNYLFVHSTLMGKKEDDTQFKYSTVIDIYDIARGAYVYSFYLPNTQHKNISQFKVINGYVYTIHDSFIYRYKIQLPT
ncbi:MAG: hypothetical protein P0Y49_09340 [Candidatus Pedobacter colombiensis]|uniref:Uncharacterized protein n=1 Tax=Candidatus Pedobacter colombiensis TaxID=3121371 RepID=A0AAJ5WD92_9SPHI|nr:hypothetical protein [Pedobacter sp.]WEK21344.1 MAG: hypothetical protein P0Y49_09340 [Pedobacter sp.]